MERPPPSHAPWRPLLAIPGARCLQSGHLHPAQRRPARSHRHLYLPHSRPYPCTPHSPRRPCVYAPFPPTCPASGRHEGAPLRLSERHLSPHNRPPPTDAHRTHRCPPGAPSRHRHHTGAGNLSSLWCTAHRPEPRLARAQAPLRYEMRSQGGHIAHVGHSARERDRGRDCCVLSAGQRPAGTLWAGGKRHPLTPREVQPPAHRGSSKPAHPVSCLTPHPLFDAIPSRP